VDALLTLKQVQEILQVDRTTIHRMLKDGRLAGVKIGGQWRFSRQEIEALTCGAVRKGEDWDDSVLPLFCIQRMQDVFAEVAGIGAVVTDLDGVPLTAMSNAGQFCALILSSPSGKAACQESWRQMSRSGDAPAQFHQCHAGLQYSRALIEVEGQPVAALVSGQFHLTRPDPQQYDLILQRLSAQHAIALDALRQAALNLPILNEKYQAQIGEWLEKVALTFSDVSNERARLLSRLHQIAEITLDVDSSVLARPSR